LHSPIQDKILTETRTKFQKISILVPVYNEKKTVTQVLEAISGVKLMNDIEKEIIVVDDGSKDNTVEIVKKFIEDNPSVNIKLHEHGVNQGKGAALHTGISKASGDLIIVQDADLEYDPKDYKFLLTPILSSRMDVVFGSRCSKKMNFFQLIGNKTLTMISNLFTGLELTDMETGYKLIKASYIKDMILTSYDFGIEPEITSKLSKIPGIDIKEVAISYSPRNYREGKKIRFKDGLLALFYILKFNLI